MLRLTCVFFIWIASTASALDDADADYDVELHEAYVLAWSEADDRQRRLLERAQRGWRFVLTNTNVRTIMPRNGIVDSSIDPSIDPSDPGKGKVGTDQR